VALTETKLKALSAVWALALLGWIVLLAAEWYFTDGVACPLDPNSSLYGTAPWSWLPPDPTRSAAPRVRDGAAREPERFSQPYLIRGPATSPGQHPQFRDLAGEIAARECAPLGP
jgi:hypothetical protein